MCVVNCCTIATSFSTLPETQTMNFRNQDKVDVSNIKKAVTGVAIASMVNDMNNKTTTIF